ncbi:MAG TPA: hypothetical protein VGO58_19660 [Chitinophagaceae bacterium]|jgi:hypothetical protein|nr:hypothetical protein [Chitinophagaceae bacterium]
MRHYLFALFIIFPVLSFGQQWKSFTDTAGKFIAKYPSEWVNKIKENNRVFFTSPSDGDADIFLENINISVTTKAGYGTSLKVKDLFPAITDALKEQFNEFTEESQRFFKWNNADAAEITYTGYSKLDESIKVRAVQWYCFYRSRLYIATFVAEAANAKHNNTARKIMNGILFK